MADHPANQPAVNKLGPLAVSPDGGLARDDPARQQGQWEQTLGSTKEALGGLTGIDSLKNAGAEQRRVGEQKEAQGQLSDLGQGVVNRVEGGVKSAIAGVTGDREARDKWDAVHDSGKTAQRSAEADIQRNA